jgi:hypothetical protein
VPGTVGGMASNLTFTTAKRRTEPITFELDGREISYTPQKLAGSILPMLDEDATEADSLRAEVDWFENGLSADDAQWIEDRLRDPEDDFDMDGLSAIIKALFRQVNGRPTKSSGGSSASRRKTGKR